MLPTVRDQVADDDVAAVRRLSERIDAADPDRAASPPVLPVLEAQPDAGRIATAVIRRASEPAELAAAAVAWRERTTAPWRLALLVHPDDEIDMLAIGAAALHPVLAAVGKKGGGPVQWWVRRSTDEDNLLADRLGFDLAREVVQLRWPCRSPSTTSRPRPTCPCGPSSPVKTTRRGWP